MRIRDISGSDFGDLEICRYVVKTPVLAAFRRPSTLSQKVNQLEKGEIFYGLFQVEGEPFMDIPIWIAHIRLGYLWFGGLEEIRFDNAIDNLRFSL